MKWPSSILARGKLLVILVVMACTMAHWCRFKINIAEDLDVDGFNCCCVVIVCL